MFRLGFPRYGRHQCPWWWWWWWWLSGPSVSLGLGDKKTRKCRRLDTCLATQFNINQIKSRIRKEREETLWMSSSSWWPSKDSFSYISMFTFDVELIQRRLGRHRRSRHRLSVLFILHSSSIRSLWKQVKGRKRKLKINSVFVQHRLLFDHPLVRARFNRHGDSTMSTIPTHTHKTHPLSQIPSQKPTLLYPTPYPILLQRLSGSLDLLLTCLRLLSLVMIFPAKKMDRRSSHATPRSVSFPLSILPILFSTWNLVV